MNIKKTLLTVGVVGGMVATSLAAVSAVSAESGFGNGDLVQKIAQKFNLSENDVQAVFEENKEERQAERNQRLEERLTQAVTDGKITSDQKDKIVAKLAEIQTKREANHEEMEGKTEEERKAAREAERAELDQWAKDNGISTEYLRFGFGKGGRGAGRNL